MAIPPIGSSNVEAQTPIQRPAQPLRKARSRPKQKHSLRILSGSAPLPQLCRIRLRRPLKSYRQLLLVIYRRRRSSLNRCLLQLLQSDCR